MGVINATPDSFYSLSRKQTEKDILNEAEKMLLEGADFLDIGGYSSRPEADDISVDEERKRVLSPIQLIKKHLPEAIISIDTFRSEIARQSVESGAAMVNDISGGQLDPDMISEVAKLKVPYVAMHMKGTPQTMKNHAHYDDLLREIIYFFSGVLEKCRQVGINDLLVDPGFGFAKTIQHNFELISKLDILKVLERPLLVGLSRKSMIYKTLSISSKEALNGTTVLNTLALLKGASILRVHDVREAKQIVTLLNQID
jgi:dihydropteroate synthase